MTKRGRETERFRREKEERRQAGKEKRRERGREGKKVTSIHDKIKIIACLFSKTY